MKQNSLSRLFMLVTVLSIAACATSKPAQVWQDPGYSGSADNLMIMATNQRSTQRRVYEDLFDKTISAFDVETVTSYSVANTELSLSPRTIKSAILRENLNAILVIRLKGFDEKEKYKSPNESEHYKDYNTYYEYAKEQSESVGLRRFNAFMLETCLFDAGSGQLIWSMQSETIERSVPRNKLQDQITLTVIKMAKDGMIPLTSPE